MNAATINRVTVLSFALFLTSHAIADESPPTLARFVDGDDSLQKLIEFPVVDDDVAMIVFCLARVRKSGDIVRNHCFPSENVDQSFRDAIDTAVKSARASPATVDSKARSVRLYYHVNFFQKDGATEVGVHSNWGVDVDKYGLSYEAPQRYTDAIFPQFCSFMDIESGHVAMVIGTDGTVKGDVALELGDGNDVNRCENSIKNTYRNFKYIPGHQDGRPIEATFVEAWVN